MTVTSEARGVSDRLGVSRGPSREALRQMEQEGVVEYETNRGCFVRELTQADILENALLQVQLELAVLELLNGKLPDETLENMSRAVEEMVSDEKKVHLPQDDRGGPEFQAF